jgi:hypothetical protein
MADFATRALSNVKNGILQELPKMEAERRLHKTNMSCMKRSRNTFDMTSFLEASQQVEDSIAFPSIEWPSIEGSDVESDDENSFTTASRPFKRHCRGLVRCDRSDSLSTLAHTVQRRGSNGSMV